MTHPPSADPAGLTVAGRYRVGECIGEGGSSRVFAARDTWLDDHPVALKVIHRQDPELARDLAREFALLFRIRHPHIARVYELGRLRGELTSAGLPASTLFLVQELYEGSAASGWLRRAPRRPTEVAAVGAQIAAALATLHAQGIRHGDIKPLNIIIEDTETDTGRAPAPRAKLIDFGLAARDRGTKDRRSGTFAGTPRYMAPEALSRGQEPASDIYGLGATLYTLLTGEPPAGAQGAQQTCGELGEVVAAMTHPSVEQRCDAAEAFEMLLVFTDPEQRRALESLRDQGAEPQGLCGRPDLVDALDRICRAPITGPRVLRLNGPPGSGKTAALAEAVARTVVCGWRCPGAIRTGADGALAAVRRVIAEQRAEAWEPDPVPASLPEADLRAGLMQRFAVLAESCREITSPDDPVALVFDDVPAGSPLDGFASFLARLGDEGPAILWIQAGGENSDLDLSPLDATATEQVIRIARPLRPHDTRAAGAVHRASGGNPATIAALLVNHVGDALLRGAQDGSLARQADSFDTLGAALARRLEQLDDAGRDLVMAVALLEPRAPLTLLRLLPRLGERVNAAALERGIALGLLCDRSSEHEVAVGPAGELIGRQLCDRAPEALVREVAETLETVATVRTERAALLGRLWGRLGECERAAEPLLMGARRANGQLRFPDALELYDAFLAHRGGPRSAGDPTVAQAQIESARLLLALGRANEAIDRFHAASQHPQARLGEAEALVSLGRYGEAAVALGGAGPEGEDSGAVAALAARARMLEGCYDEAIEIITAATQRQSPHPNEAELRNVQALVAFHRGEMARARELLETAVALAQRQGCDRLVASTLANLGLILHKTGELHAAEQAYTESLTVARRLHDLPRQVIRLGNLAALRQEQHKFDAALAGYEEAAHLARLMDGRREAVRVNLNRANLLGWLGDTDEALVLAGGARRDAAELVMPTERAFLALVEAELRLARGDSVTADGSVQEARSLFTASENRAGLAECDAVAAEIALYTRRVAEAQRLASAAAAQARAIGRERIEGQALLWLAFAGLDAAGSDSEEVTAAIDAAERAAALGASMADPDMEWLAHAALYRMFARRGRNIDADLHLAKARQLASAARSRLSARYERSYSEVWYRRELSLVVRQGPASTTDEHTRSLDRLLAINRELARDRDPDRLLERIIDAAIALSGAERGLIVLAPETGLGIGLDMDGAPAPDRGPVEEESLVIHAARNIDPEAWSGASSEEGDLEFSRSIAASAMRSGLPVTSIDAQDDDRFDGFMSVHALNLRSVLCLPLRSQDGVLGALYLDHRHRVNAFSDADVALLSAFGDQAAIALANARLVSKLAGRTRDLEHTRRAVEELNQRLAEELKARAAELDLVRSRRGEQGIETGRHGMIGRCPQMREVYRVIDRVADREVPVTILGESGTGKELVARAIHQASKARHGAFVSVNCGAIPATLLESELFGHERGAFTGAVRSKPGLFEVAHGGTIFLDEIGDMPFEMQVKLLRVLQQKEYRRVGGTKYLSTNARVLSASNRDLEEMVRAGDFREDLWYRLNVVEIRVPPLRERREDLPVLIAHLLDIYGGNEEARLTRDAHALLLDYDWPGNVRELENEIQRATALTDGIIEPNAFSGKLLPKTSLGTPDPGAGAASPALVDGVSLKEVVERFERETIVAVLKQHHGKVAAAANILGLTRAGLYKKINKYRIVVDKR